MSQKELNRIPVLQQVCDKLLTQAAAAKLLKLSVRQLQRILVRYLADGAAGITSRKRGKPASNRAPDDLKLRVLTLLREKYGDFGPTLATEKLIERHQISISVETVRNWMIADGLWVPHARRKPRVYQPRYRRDCLGELIQIDGSHHDWFEGRASKCCLLVYIDDATGRLMHLRFCETESAFDYMLATREYIEKHGKPVAFYSDKHAVFRVSQAETRRTGTTQFGRVLHDLNIELICANSSQAKGRVERANLTLQDRLIKEMRLEGINSIEEANAWLDSFILDFNRRFAKAPKYPKNLHRSVNEQPAELDDIFAWQEFRTLSKSLAFQYDKMLYLVEPTEENTRIAGEKIMVYDYPDGTLAFKYGHRTLAYQVFDKLAIVDQGAIVDNKRLGAVLKLAQAQQDERDRDGQRERSKRMPKRRAQARIQEQLRAINPVLVNPEEFRASLKR
ncbi:ISNCY family transposase [Serratia marcescens]|uniref:ISNCY family transposase n=1 Tax=Serratia marcescens TaxID=615 RepID=UPI003EE01FDD